MTTCSGTLWQGLLTVEMKKFQLTYACTSPALSDAEKYPSVADHLCRHLSVRRDGAIAFIEVASVCFVQFVRSVAPSTSYGLAFAYFGKAYGWKYYLVAHFATMGGTAKSIEDAIKAIVEGAAPRSISLKKEDSASVALQKFVDSKLRIIILLLPAPEMRELAVLWKQQAFKDRWVWMTDNKVKQVDFESDTPEVRLAGFFFSCSDATTTNVGLNHRRVVMCHRQTQQETHSMGGCTYPQSILIRHESATSSAKFAS